jgi:CRP-like cAMP-binding protein
MIFDYDVLVISSFITLILTLAMLIYYFPKIITLNTRIKESTNIVQNIISELNRRLHNQDKKIIDHDVKLEIIELKLSRLIAGSSAIKKDNSINIEKSISSKTYESDSSHNINNKTINLNETDKLVIELLSKKEMTSRELQNNIKKTREHTSRILQKLFLNDYITRNERKRPFIYRIKK